jgi:hypothetical protein
MTQHVLISPLGFAAGAVSGVYFALQAYQGVHVDKVITVGTRHDEVRNAAATLGDLFPLLGDVEYQSHYIDAEYFKGKERDASGPFAARMGLYIDQAHKAGHIVHVAVTGGRSGMGALAALAAQIYRADHLYHLWVDSKIERDGIAKALPDPQNKYINPTVEDGLCELVNLPFVNLAGLIEAVKQSPTELPEPWAERLTEKPPIALDTLLGYVPPGLSLRSARELLGLGEQWLIHEETSKVAHPDVYYRYEAGLHLLRNRTDKSTPRYLELLTYEHRLKENITKSRLYGDTPTRRAERNEIIHYLNGLALSVLNEAFNDVCDSVSLLGREQIWLRSLSILYSAGALDDTGRTKLGKSSNESVDSRYGQSALEKAPQGDDLGFFKWLTENAESLTTLSKLVTTGASVGTFVLKGIEIWLKSQGIL